MLLVDEPLGLLIDQLRSLAPRDRRAVMARLQPAERVRLQRALDVPVRIEQLPVYSPDIAARITGEAADTAMTTAGREALARVVERQRPAPLPATPASLVERVGAWWRA